MGSRRDMRLSLRPNKKLRLYLEELGFIDRRTGLAKKSQNLNKFLNDVIIHVLENEKHPRREIASAADLSAAFRKLAVAERNHKIAQLRQEIQSIVDWKGE